MAACANAVWLQNEFARTSPVCLFCFQRKVWRCEEFICWLRNVCLLQIKVDPKVFHTWFPDVPMFHWPYDANGIEVEES